jgi:glycosyltransferase involved in cell wall biosynthesis
MLFKSGIGRYLREIISRYPDSEAGFVAVCNEKEQQEWLRSKCRNVSLVFESGDIYGLQEQWRRPWLLRKSKVIWTPHYNFPVFSSSKQVVTVHDLAHLALPEIFGRGMKRFYAKLMLYAVALRAERTIFVSEFTRREFVRLIGREPANATVIPNGISSDWCNAEAGAAGDYLLYVGNVKPHKNLGRLISALKAIRQEISCNLRIVGKRQGFITGDALDELEDPLLAQRIEFTGEISDGELKSQYAGAKALVFPSLYEGFGFPPLEAMASGCPALVARAASLPEVCGEGFSAQKGTGNVIYFDPFDTGSMAAALRLLFRLTENERLVMTSNARHHVKRFSWDDTAVATWSLLGDVVSGR